MTPHAAPWHNGRLMLAGRYHPPTAADAMAFEIAATWTPNLTVVLAASDDDEIAPLVRHAWLAELAPRAGIVPVEIASARWDEDEVQRRLASTIREITYLRPDGLVGPGLRDLPLARAMGVPYIPVDVEPLDGPLPNPFACWDRLPPPVRAHYVRRVVVMGPESTGKTTLAGDLARHFGTRWVTEYLRIWLDAKGTACEPDDLPAVVAGHRATEEALARVANRVLFCDTDPLMTAVYSRFYYGEVPGWLDEAASARRADVYLLLDCDVPWVPDPQRDMPHRRHEIRDLCARELDARGLPWVLVGGTWDQRRAQAVSAVTSLVEQGPGW